uniref:Kazal-like domain-containing protein n=1 Tax=Chelydra serpentina TaxID=8475 RepID=A0A8C3TJQ1_CHESE
MQELRPSPDLPYNTCLARGCEKRMEGQCQCVPQLCPRATACPAGLVCVCDHCGCCLECGNTEGQPCDLDGSGTFYGLCGENLESQLDIQELGYGGIPEPQCMFRSQGAVCGSDHITYQNICEFQEAMREREGRILITSDGPCQPLLPFPLNPLFLGKLPQLVFTSFQFSGQSVSPSASVLGELFPAVDVDLNSLQVPLTDTLEAKVGPSCSSVSGGKFSIQQESEHAGDLRTFQHLVVRYSITPSDPEYATEAAHVEGIQSLFLRSVGGPSFAGVEKSV